MDNLYVDAKLVNQKVQFSTVSRLHADQPIPMDYVPPLGDGEGLAGLEVLLASFCGCVSTAVVALLRRAGKNIDSYECTAEGIRQENPLALKKILFDVRIQSDDIEAATMDQVLGAAASVSPVWLAIKGNVDVETTYRIIS